jgi:cell division protein FtsL
MLFIIIVALSALFVAGCAAFFSIKGLITLFAGSALAIGVMAASLEIGKLVAASFLHTYWKSIRFLLKAYLCTAVFVLMCITSLGIFGFLTNAYQVHSSKVGSFDTKITALANEKSSLDQEIQELSSRVKTLTEIRQTQEQRIQAAGNFKAPREQAYKAIAEANEEIQKKEADIAKDRSRGIEIEKELAELKISLNTTTDIGSFKFIADALNTTVDTAVQYFIFLLIGVFDPLAVALVLAWNKLIEVREDKKKKDEEFIQTVLSSSPVAVPPSPEADDSSDPVQAEKTEEYFPTEIVSFFPKDETEDVQPEEKPEESIAVENASSIEPLVSMVVTPDEPISIVSTSGSNMHNAEKELLKDPSFLKLTEEQKKEELARRRRLMGSNNSVITSIK